MSIRHRVLRHRITVLTGPVLLITEAPVMALHPEPTELLLLPVITNQAATTLRLEAAVAAATEAVAHRPDRLTLQEAQEA